MGRKTTLKKSLPLQIKLKILSKQPSKLKTGWGALTFLHVLPAGLWGEGTAMTTDSLEKARRTSGLTVRSTDTSKSGVVSFRVWRPTVKSFSFGLDLSVT